MGIAVAYNGKVQSTNERLREKYQGFSALLSEEYDLLRDQVADLPVLPKGQLAFAAVRKIKSDVKSFPKYSKFCEPLEELGQTILEWNLIRMIRHRRNTEVH
ncbi:uncharacterized protein DFL_000631 [Arthrobotrys flagrans]|uniref:Uncharacterized protein n=1 Tax=Arthrobotrys flagrans TaxID=97331 RepID=A0A437AEG0_ARTFL|nr:hypothetical protein DFL_000631 [Arthrobotrys flagrans]